MIKEMTDGVPLIYHLAGLGNRSPEGLASSVIIGETFYMTDAETGHLLECHYEGRDLHLLDTVDESNRVAKNCYPATITYGGLEAESSEVACLVGNNKIWGEMPPIEKEVKMDILIAVDIAHQMDKDYHDYLAALNAQFQALVVTKRPIFTTDAKLLWEEFQEGFDPALRKHYDCRACKRFIEKFGGLVVVDANGDKQTLFWSGDNVPSFMIDSIAMMRKRVDLAKITGVFICSEETWGQPSTVATGQSPYTGQVWQHLAVLPPKEFIYHGVIKTAEQVAAAKLEDYKTVMNALDEFKPEHVDLALTILDAEALYRGEQYLGVTKWMKSLYEIRSIKNHTTRYNLIWVKIAEAPDGFCHIRSGMIGTLLEDLKKGLPFNVVKARFDEKMNPIVHQRPQAAPTAGNIAQAEKIVSLLGVENSLKRRFLREDEVQAVWRPKAKQERSEEPTGVFGHLKPKSAAPSSEPMIVPDLNMSWERFAEKVLPQAEELYISLYSHVAYGELAPLVTAVDMSAPPILKWDTPECRNPVSWFHRQDGYFPTDLNLVPNPDVRGIGLGTLYNVSAVALQPCMWNNNQSFEFGKAVMFILEGARFSARGNGLCLFPQMLKSEFHSIKPTIEAFSNKGKIEGIGEPMACGFRVGTEKSSWSRLTVTVKQGNIFSSYNLDRWN